MENAFKEIQSCLRNNKHQVSTETLQLALEALRIVKEQEHNGMKNYPTWLVASEIDNREEIYNICSSLVDEMREAGEKEFTILGVLSQTIEAHYSTGSMKYRMLIDKAADKYKDSYAADIWSCMINHCEKDLVNYREIAKRFLEDH